MHKWEYRTVVRSRTFTASTERHEPWMEAQGWDKDIDVELQKLGEEGWELVSVSPRSSYLGGQKAHGGPTTADFAGFTDQEVWVFKRPKP